MKKKIVLPNNWFGVSVMVAAWTLIATVPFAVAFWAVDLVAPWWVATPVAAACSFYSLALCAAKKKEVA